jgi:hypothetical protein
MSTPATPPRRAVAALSLGALALFVAFDLATSAPIDHFAAPAPVALGSGQAAGAAHCAAPPAGG